MKQYLLGAVAIALALTALISTNSNQTAGTQQTLADGVIATNEIRLGYIVYPPLLFKDEKTGELSGISYDLVEAAAKNLGLTTVWVEEVGWGSALEGLKNDRYDMLGTQMWPNSARAREAVFSVAPMNSVVYPYVRANDTRFDANISTVNDPSYTISSLDGDMSLFVAKEEFPRANIASLPQLSSYAEMFLNVVNKKADILFVEPSAAKDFLASHLGSIKQVGETPIRTFGNSFAIKRGEHDMAAMMDIAIRQLINDGTVSRILEKYDASAVYTINK